MLSISGYNDMKCDTILKRMYSETVSIKGKKAIDDHISHCSYCQGQLKSESAVQRFLGGLNPVKRPETFWQKLLRDIREYRERKLESGWSVLHILPPEVSYKRIAVAAAACVTIAVSSTLYMAQEFESAQLTNEVREEIEFYLLEHELATDDGLFGGVSVTGVMASVPNHNKPIPKRN